VANYSASEVCVWVDVVWENYSEIYVGFSISTEVDFWGVVARVGILVKILPIILVKILIILILEHGMVVWGDGLTLDAGDGTVVVTIAIILLMAIILKILVVGIILVIWGVWGDLVGVILVVVGKILIRVIPGIVIVPIIVVYLGVKIRLWMRIVVPVIIAHSFNQILLIFKVFKNVFQNL